MSDTHTPSPGILTIALAALMLALVASGWQPYDRVTWLMEVLPVMIAVPVLLATRRRFPLTTLLYACIFVHGLVLMLGGAYTYARVPLGFQIADALGLHRNPYDKIGHFFQGFVPALVAREILVRGNWIDIARERIPASEKIYTWWSYRAADWQLSNRGRRLDHIWVSPALRDRVSDFRISRDARGWERPSDHVPVTTVFEV